MSFFELVYNKSYVTWSFQIKWDPGFQNGEEELGCFVQFGDN